MHLKRFLPFLAAFLLVAPIEAGTISSASPFVVIGNPSVSVKSLSQAEARLIFSANMKTWQDGTPISLVVMQSNSQTHSKFVQQVLNLYAYQLERAWQRKTYSGAGESTIITVNSTKEMIQVVDATKGSIGYIEETELPAKHSVIEVTP